MSEFFIKKQAAKHHKIGAALGAIKPEEFITKEFASTLEHLEGDDTLSFQLTHSHNSKEPLSINDELLLLYKELEELCGSYTKRWRSSSFLRYWDSDRANWEYKTEYAY